MTTTQDQLSSAPLAPRVGDAPPHPRAVLGIVLVGYFMVVLDNSIVITGLPHIAADLAMTRGSLAWVVNAYLLAFGGLLLLGARAGDLLGRRRTFVVGLVVFTLASAGVGLAPTGALLVAARAAQGLGSAVLAPSTLALLTASFPDGPRRTRATTAYGAVAGIGASVGLVAGGLLADLVTWRAGFLINVPIGIAMLVAGLRVLPETPRSRGRLDLPGAVLATAGPAAVVYALVRVGERGWTDPAVLLAMLVGVLLVAGLVLVERSAAQPVLVLGLFRDREHAGAYVARALFMGSMMGFFVFTSQFMQARWGWSALAAGLGFFPMTTVNFAVAVSVTRLQRRVPAAVLLVTGLALAAVGTAALGLVGPSSTYLPGVALPMVLVGAGQGLAFGPLTSSGIARVDPTQAGAASGVVSSVHQLGGALGMSLVLAVSGTYAAAMRDGAVLVALAVLTAAALVVPAAARRGRP
ncbi:putative MFS-type transporter EfpA [Cellulomonas sp. T2.31MG-18]|uniref:MFS transporter n=1 Tax=Cellulomonas sp. T2.31MG-18 TaxID=3157619 RepID=UPI0035E6B373